MAVPAHGPYMAEWRIKDQSSAYIRLHKSKRRGGLGSGMLTNLEGGLKLGLSLPSTQCRPQTVPSTDSRLQPVGHASTDDSRYELEHGDQLEHGYHLQYAGKHDYQHGGQLDYEFEHDVTRRLASPRSVQASRDASARVHNHLREEAARKDRLHEALAAREAARRSRYSTREATTRWLQGPGAVGTSQGRRPRDGCRGQAQ